MATKTIKGRGALREAHLPSPDQGTQGNAQLERNPQVVWAQGTAAKAKAVKMFGQFEAIPTSGVDSDFKAWEALSDEAFNNWERVRKKGNDV